MRFLRLKSAKNGIKTCVTWEWPKNYIFHQRALFNHFKFKKNFFFYKIYTDKNNLICCPLYKYNLFFLFYKKDIISFENTFFSLNKNVFIIVKKKNKSTHHQNKLFEIRKINKVKKSCIQLQNPVLKIVFWNDGILIYKFNLRFTNWVVIRLIQKFNR